MNINIYEAMFTLREPIIRAAIRHLDLPAGSRGLDAGCNVGLISKLLAEAVSPGGHVTGLDISSQYLDYAQANRGDDLGARISFEQGDVNNLPFGENCFDWIWSMDTIWPGPREFGCPSEDPLPLVEELARVVKPGGTIALLYWSAQKLLPGYPHLEARLSCTSQTLAPFTKSTKPAYHFMRSLGWLRAAGLTNLSASTFAGEAVAPLNEAVREAMKIAFPMFWSDIENEVSPEDWAEYKRLCSPQSPDFILNDPDYYALFTYTMFQGRVS